MNQTATFGERFLQAIQGWLVSVRGYALTQSSLKPHEHLERVSTVLVGGMDRGQQAVAAASIDSRVQ